MRTREIGVRSIGGKGNSYICGPRQFDLIPAEVIYPFVIGTTPPAAS